MKTNEKRLVMMSVAGEISPPVHMKSPYGISADTGEAKVFPMVGGITYNVKIGDSAVNWEADHVEPGVSVRSCFSDQGGASSQNAFTRFACIGNEAIVVSGDAKGKKGTVVGKHGGIENIIIDFSQGALNKMMIGDKILIRAFGLGLKLLDLPEITIVNLDPSLLALIINPQTVNGKLKVPVTHLVPAKIMGSGLGQPDVYSGDYDIQLFDKPTRKKYGLDSLRLGDIISIIDVDHRFGRIYRKGYVSIGVVVHTNSVLAGHGPGVTSIITGQKSKIEPVIDKNANLSKILKRKKTKAKK